MQQYKVLGAMLALRRFTVEELVRASGAPEPTVRNVIRENNAFIERTGKAETGRRGGQRLNYQLTKAGEDNTKSRLRELYEALPPFDAAAPGPTHMDDDEDLELSRAVVRSGWRRLQAASRLTDVKAAHKRLLDDLDIYKNEIEVYGLDPDGRALAHRSVLEKNMKIASALDLKINTEATTDGKLADDFLVDLFKIAQSALTESGSTHDGLRGLREEREVLILDAIPDRSNDITPTLESVLLEKDMKDLLRRQHMAVRAISDLSDVVNLSFIDGAFRVATVFLTINSAALQARKEIFNFMDTIFKNTYLHNFTGTIFDVSFNSDIRNRALGNKARYEANAGTLKRGAVQQILRGEMERSRMAR